MNVFKNIITTSLQLWFQNETTQRNIPSGLRKTFQNQGDVKSLCWLFFSIMIESLAHRDRIPRWSLENFISKRFYVTLWEKNGSIFERVVGFFIMITHQRIQWTFSLI